MKVTTLLLGAALAGGLAGLASAADKPAPASQSCFFVRDWGGNWKAPDDHTIYMRVNNRDVYRIDLQGGSNFLTGPDPHLINRIRGSDTICSPLDLDLEVSDGSGGAVEPIIAKSLVKLTPQQVAAIPKKFVP